MSNFKQVTIVSESGKGRAFSALLLGSVEADNLWQGGLADTDNQRPVWAMFAGTEQELRPFCANLITGRKISIGERSYYGRKSGEKMEFLKSTKYQVAWQREAEGSVLTVFLPELFQMDPGMVDPKVASFVCLPSRDWITTQAINLEPILEHLEKIDLHGQTVASLFGFIPLAYLFAAYLDRRTRCPLVSDGRFYMQLMLACLHEGLAAWPSTGNHYYRDKPWGENPTLGFHQQTEGIEMSRGIAFQANHAEIERVLSEQTEIFFDQA